MLNARGGSPQFPLRELALDRCADIVWPMNTSQAPRATTSNESAFGRLLKDWRGRRGFSQLDLALAARTTQRHLSFIESGRATPSREMILRLATTMDLPLRQQNALMLAAGYAPAWRERALSTPELAVVNSALDYMLAQHEPYPAFVIDRCWNLLRANRGAMNLTEFLIGPAPSDASSKPVNLAVTLVSPDGLRPFIVNWQEVALYFVRGVQADAHADGNPETADLLSRLLTFPEVPSLSEMLPPDEGHTPVLPIHFQRDEISLRLFTTIATLGTPRDVTLQEVRIEFFFPMDEVTEQALRSWASGGPRSYSP
jgi:transcriptional regulator with XRE-family HTH domain